MDLTYLVWILIQGLCLGSLIALVAVGYTLIYGVIGLINFAHGEFYMVAAYCGFGVYVLLGDITPIFFLIPLILIAAAIGGATIAVITEWVAYRPIRKASRLAALLTAIGVSFLLQSIFGFVNGGAPLNYGTDEGRIGHVAQARFMLSETLGVRYIELSFIPITIVLTAVLWWMVMKTKFGKSMRALAQDPDAAALMGIDVNGVARMTFLIGGLVAGIGGAMAGFAYSTAPMMGFLPGLKAFVAAVIGGIGSIPGSFLGAYLIGITQSLLEYFGLSKGYAEIAVFGILVVMLLIRPQGLLGKVKREKV